MTVCAVGFDLVMCWIDQLLPVVIVAAPADPGYVRIIGSIEISGNILVKTIEETVLTDYWQTSRYVCTAFQVAVSAVPACCRLWLEMRVGMAGHAIRIPHLIIIRHAMSAGSLYMAKSAVPDRDIME